MLQISFWHSKTSSNLTEINLIHSSNLQIQVKNKLKLTFSTLQEADNEQKPKTLHSAARRHHYWSLEEFSLYSLMNPVIKAQHHRKQWSGLLIFIPGEAQDLKEKEKKKLSIPEHQ